MCTYPSCTAVWGPVLLLQVIKMQDLPKMPQSIEIHDCIVIINAPRRRFNALLRVYKQKMSPFQKL